MAESRMKIDYNGKLVDAVEVPAIHTLEPWSEYKLEDGTLLRVKFAIGSIVRLDTEKDAEGNPVYLTKGTVIAMPIFVAGSNQKL